jgi:hypothetical protein
LLIELPGKSPTVGQYQRACLFAINATTGVVWLLMILSLETPLITCRTDKLLASMPEDQNISRLK